MRVMTTFDLVEMFPAGQSVAVVGNAPALKGAGLGGWIDGHGIVVRFNECAVDEFAKDVGGRTDILVTNPYPEGRTREPIDGGECRLVVVINPLTRRGDRAAFERYIGDRSVLFTYSPDVNHHHQGPLTTGTYALALLPALLAPKTVAVLGFTCFLDDTAHHYWSTMTPPGAAKHDHVGDARTLLAIINRLAAKITVTSEIAWVARRVGIGLDSRVAIRSLPDPKWLD